MARFDQEAVGASVYAAPLTIRRIRDWLRAAKTDGPNDPLFVRIYKGEGRVGRQALSAQAVRRIIQRRAADAGITGRVSGHSMRIAHPLVGCYPSTFSRRFRENPLR